MCDKFFITDFIYNFSLLFSSSFTWCVYIKAFKMVNRYLISDSLQELAIVEFSDGNIEFQKVLFPKF